MLKEGRKKERAIFPSLKRRRADPYQGRLPVFTQEFEMSLRVVTGRTFFKGLLALIKITAIPTAPSDLLLALKDSSGFNIFFQLQIPFFMLFFRRTSTIST